jgi:hypothetical protein
MRANLEQTNLLFKTKNTNKQTESSSNGQVRDERHNTVKDGQMYSEEAEVVNLVREHLQT